MADFKISKPTIYAIVVACGAGLYFYTLPKPSTAVKATTRVGHSAIAAKGGDDLITPADLTAVYSPYKGPRHDAFLPLVSTNTVLLQGPAGTIAGSRGIWTLTGITTINGRDSALVENSATGDSVTLQAGDHWNNRRVVRVGAESVTLVNAQGQRTELLFPPPEAPKTAEDTAPIAEAEPTPTPEPPTIIQPNITIQAPAFAAPAANPGGGFGGGQPFPFGGFPGGFDRPGGGNGDNNNNGNPNNP